MSARERILDAAVRRIAREGIDDVRIARIATDAGVSSSLVHYHFESRDALLEEALEHSYERAGDVRTRGAPRCGSRRLGDGRPVPAGARALRDDFILWVELWLRAARRPELRETSARLYARLHEWFREALEGAVRDPASTADRVLALCDGYGIRVLCGDPAMPRERARRGDLGRGGARARLSASSSGQRLALTGVSAAGGAVGLEDERRLRARDDLAGGGRDRLVRDDARAAGRRSAQRTTTSPAPAQRRAEVDDGPFARHRRPAEQVHDQPSRASSRYASRAAGWPAPSASRSRPRSRSAAGRAAGMAARAADPACWGDTDPQLDLDDPPRPTRRPAPA